jgi:hypothetical protein
VALRRVEIGCVVKKRRQLAETSTSRLESVRG